jgi:hypothetical protein
MRTVLSGRPLSNQAKKHRQIRIQNVTVGTSANEAAAKLAGTLASRIEIIQ